jgi:hypothetical protein
LRGVERIDVEVSPPQEFVTALVKLAMMKPAEGDGEFVTHFAPECPLFSKPKVMRIRRGAPAGQTRLRTHEPQMIAVPHPDGFIQRRHLLNGRLGCCAFG